MAKIIQHTTDLLARLRFSQTAQAFPELIEQGNKNESTPIEFLQMILEYELTQREEKSLQKRLKVANFPYYRPIEEFNLAEQPSLSRQNFKKLRELSWIEQTYNLVFLGPTGTGKTFLSVGLGIKAVHEGYKVAFVTIVYFLKTMEYTVRSMRQIKRFKQVDLLIIDDLMFMAMDKKEANLFFHLINEIYENTSIILTSNKSPNDWGQLIGGEIITGAILDRIVQRSEIIQLSGDSYRLSHREGIFENKKTDNKIDGLIN